MFIPFVDPVLRTECGKGSFKLLARLKILTFIFYAPMVVDVVLPAMLALIPIGKLRRWTRTRSGFCSDTLILCVLLLWLICLRCLARKRSEHEKSYKGHDDVTSKRRFALFAG